MHFVGIVHNDLQWDKVVVHDNNYILIDFDDAYILSKADTKESCPGLNHLRADGHPLAHLNLIVLK